MIPDLQTLNEACKNTLAESLGIEIIRADKNEVVGTMPVDPRTHQPLGYLHGGASVALAETLASIGGWIQTAEEGRIIFGLEINANHIKNVRSGVVTGTARPVHVGKTTQVWSIDIRDETGRLLSTSRCTLAVVESQ